VERSRTSAITLHLVFARKPKKCFLCMDAP
jgi:hypothetical protein